MCNLQRYRGWSPVQLKQELDYRDRELREAGRALALNYQLWLVECHPDGRGVCHQDHRWRVVRHGYEILVAAQSRLAPVVYMVHPRYVDLASLSEADFDRLMTTPLCYWLGDISRDGQVLAGGLLAQMVEVLSVDGEQTRPQTEDVRE